MRLIRALAAAAAVVILGAACGGASGGTGGGTVTGSLKLKQPVTITELMVPYYGLEHIAHAEGLFAKYNLTVNMIPTPQGNASLPALAAGSTQTTQSVGITTVVTGIAQGLKIEGIASGAVSGPDYDSVRLYALMSGGINSAQDLAGKRIGMPSTAGYYQEVTRAYLKKGGVDPSKTSFVAVPQSALLGALQTKQVEAIAAGDAVFGTIETQYASTVKRLVRDQDVTPAAQFGTAYAFTVDYANGHPDVVRAFVASLRDALEFVKNNKAKAAEDIAAVEQVPVGNIVTPDFPSGLCINIAGATAWKDFLVSDNYVASNADVQNVKGWVTNKFNTACK